jgi:glycosyltransferase involved in cell wall biosynthesis
MEKTMINLMTPINSLGYGVAGLNIYKSLLELTDVGLWVIGGPEVYSPEDYQLLQRGFSTARMWDNKAPCVKIWHQHDMAQFAGRGKRIGFPFFELDKFTKQEIHSLNSLDSIFVTSQWAKEIILSETSIKEVGVVRLGVDQNIFSLKPKEHEDKTIFFNCGKWEIRKGHDVLVDLFNKAFTKQDNVELWMMCSNPFLSEKENMEWQNLYLNSNLGSKIKIIPRVRTHQEVYNIVEKIDCGIFPSRAEGWNLELLECMACGKQVITTNYSAHTEFCNKDNAYLVDVSDKEIAYDGKWFHGNSGYWATIGKQEQDSFIEHMRYVHLNKGVNTSGVSTAKNFTWNNSAKAIVHNV